MTDRTTLDTGDLWRWVDRLTKDRRQRLVRQAPGEKRTVELVDVPSLWTQLEEAVGSTNAGGGRGKASTGSRAPLDLEITSFMAEVQADVVRALRELGSPARISVGEHGTTIDIRAELRHLASAVVTTTRQQLTDQWALQYRRWVSRAETALTLDGDGIETRGIRGHACPACGADTVARLDDGETYRDPALVISFRDGQVLHATCRACTAGWWRGDQLDELSEQLADASLVSRPARLASRAPTAGRR